MKNLLIFLVHSLLIHCAYANEAIIKTFVYQSKKLDLIVYSDVEHHSKKDIFLNQHIRVIERADFYGAPLLLGWQEQNPEAITIFYREQIVPIESARNGRLIKYKSDFYILIENEFLPHTMTSIMKRVYLDENGIIRLKEIYRFPGFFSNPTVNQDHLIVSGYVNTIPFAVAIDNDTWWELRCISVDSCFNVQK